MAIRRILKVSTWVIRRSTVRLCRGTFAACIAVGCGDGTRVATQGGPTDGSTPSPSASGEETGRGGSPGAGGPSPSTVGTPGTGPVSTAGGGGSTAPSDDVPDGGRTEDGEGEAGSGTSKPIEGDAGIDGQETDAGDVNAVSCTASNIDVPVASLSGVITPPGGTARLVNDDGSVLITSDAEGAYFVSVAPGTYDLVTEDPVAGTIVIEPGVTFGLEEPVGRNFEVPRLAPIRGTVTLNGEPPQGPIQLEFANELGGYQVNIAGGEEFGAELVPGPYDVFYESMFVLSTAPHNQHAKLATLTVRATPETTFTVDIPSVGLSGNISAEGVPAIEQPTVAEIFAYAYLLGEDGDRVDLGYAPKPGYAVRLIPGTYDLYVQNEKVSEGITIEEPETVLDIVVPTGTVTGAFPDQFEPPVYGYFRLRDTLSGQEFPLSSESDTYSAVVPPGTYDVVYSGPLVVGIAENPAAGWPRTQSVVLEQGVEVVASGTTPLDLAVPSALLQGRITFGGQELTAVDLTPDSNALGWMFLRGENSDAEISLDTSDGPYALPLVPGTYDLYYKHVTDQFENTPQNAVAKIESGIVVEPGGSVHDIDIPVAVVTGKFTIGGKERGELEGYGWLFLQSEEERFPLPITSDGTFSVSLIGGTYDLYYESFLSGADAPVNTIAKIQSGLVLPSGPVQLDIDVPITTLSGALTVGGKTLETLADDGQITLRDADGNATPLGLLSLGSYEIGLIPGAYDVYFSGTRDNVFAPQNSSAKIGCLVVP